MSITQEEPSGFFDTSDNEGADFLPSQNTADEVDTEQPTDTVEPATEPITAPSQSNPEPSSPTGKHLFLPDSDDEGDALLAYSNKTEDEVAIPAEILMDVDTELEAPPTSSPCSSRSSPGPIPSSQPTVKQEEAPKVGPKKRRRSSVSPHRQKTSFYLGTFMIANAWSTAKGTGYITPGETIIIERDGVLTEFSKNVPKAKAPTKAPTKTNGKKKQQTLTSMIKTSNNNRKPVDTAVRITNTRGFGMSRGK